ncbi:MAG: hypothetical protein D6768_13110 [Chloroflexi bacterium]|nr:MAG: hypothetical protein D6768_13110 [Chloroflexota bacterium]
MEVTEESLSVDVIHEVCNGEGHYLGHPQTLKLMNSEYHYPHTANRAGRTDWELTGGLDMRERARRTARQTLKTVFPQIVPPEVDRQIRAEFNILLPQNVMSPGGYP